MLNAKPEHRFVCVFTGFAICSMLSIGYARGEHLGCSVLSIGYAHGEHLGCSGVASGMLGGSIWDIWGVASGAVLVLLFPRSG